jgi:hypothetical protein
MSIVTSRHCRGNSRCRKRARLKAVGHLQKQSMPQLASRARRLGHTPRARRPAAGGRMRASRRAGRASGRTRHASRVPEPFCASGGTERPGTNELLVSDCASWVWPVDHHGRQHSWTMAMARLGSGDGEAPKKSLTCKLVEQCTRPSPAMVGAAQARPRKWCAHCSLQRPGTQDGVGEMRVSQPGLARPCSSGPLGSVLGTPGTSDMGALPVSLRG